MEPQAGPGVSRLGVTCADLAALGEAETLFGSPLVELSTADEFPYGDIASYRLAQSTALLQRGGLHCAWNDAGGAADLVIEMLPIDSPWSPSGDRVSGAEAWADAATGHCSDEMDVGCMYEVQVGAVRMTTYAGSYAGGPDLAALRPAFDSWVAAVSRLVAARPEPVPAWQGGSPAAPASCADWGLDGAVVGGSGALRPAPELGGSVTSIVTTAVADAGALDCTWVGASGGSLYVFMLPGGAWAWADDQPHSNGSLALSPVEGLGTRAFAGCNGGCVVHALVNDSWLAVNYWVVGSDLNAAIEFTRTLIAKL